MPRTKGSLGKKTIEKLKAEGKWDYKNNKPYSNFCSQSNSEKAPEVDIFHNVNTEKNTVDLIFPEQECNYTPKKENDFASNFIDKNNESDESEVFNNINNTQEKSVNDYSNSAPKPAKENNNKSNAKLNKYNLCDRCRAVIYCEPRRIDSNLLIGLADYHRHTPRYINLCSKCCHELNDIFEDWLTNKEKGGNEDLKRYG